MLKKLVPNFFDKENKCFIIRTYNFTKTHRVLEFNQSQWLKLYIEFSTQKRIEAEKNGDKDQKALYKLMNNAVYSKTMINLRNRIDVKVVNNGKAI